MPTSTVEDYLKAILALSTEEGASGAVSLGRIGARVGVTSGTVTTMMKRLAGDGLVRYTPSQGVSLTDEGRVAAARVVRRHRLVESFLVQALGLDWTEVHQEAEALEHAISDRVEERIDEVLGRPAVDPHGDPIPDRHGRIRTIEGAPLSRAHPGTYVITRILDDDPAFLRWLGAMNLKPGTTLRVERRNEPAATLSVRLAKRKSLEIGLTAAGKLVVRRQR